MLILATTAEFWQCMGGIFVVAVVLCGAYAFLDDAIQKNNWRQ